MNKFCFLWVKICLSFATPFATLRDLSFKNHAANSIFLTTADKISLLLRGILSFDAYMILVIFIHGKSEVVTQYRSLRNTRPKFGILKCEQCNNKLKWYKKIELTFITSYDNKFLSYYCSVKKTND